MCLNITVVIPFIMRDQNSLQMLERTLHSVCSQEVIPYEVIISDDSSVTYFDDIEGFLSQFREVFANGLTIRHVRNHGPKGVAPNSNNGLKLVTSEWVHVLHADDYVMRKELYSDILQHISNDNNTNWFVLAGEVSGKIFLPEVSWDAVTNSAVLGLNCMGGPSAIIFRNNKKLFYNERINNFCDIDFSYKCLLLYGEANILESIDIFYGVGDWQVQKEFGSEAIGISELSLLIDYHKFSAANFFSAIYKRKAKLSEIYISAEAYRKQTGSLFVCILARGLRIYRSNRRLARKLLTLF